MLARPNPTVISISSGVGGVDPTLSSIGDLPAEREGYGSAPVPRPLGGCERGDAIRAEDPLPTGSMTGALGPGSGRWVRRDQVLGEHPSGDGCRPLAVGCRPFAVGCRPFGPWVPTHRAMGADPSPLGADPSPLGADPSPLGADPPGDGCRPLADGSLPTGRWVPTHRVWERDERKKLGAFHPSRTSLSTPSGSLQLDVSAGGGPRCGRGWVPPSTERGAHQVSAGAPAPGAPCVARCGSSQVARPEATTRRAAFPCAAP